MKYILKFNRGSAFDPVSYDFKLLLIQQDLEKINLMLNLGVNPNETIIYYTDRISALQFAVGKNNIRMASILIDHHAFIDHQSNHGFYALDFAFFKGNYEMFNFLLMKKFLSNNRIFNFSEDGNTILHSAMVGQNPLIVETILSIGCPFYKNISKETPFHHLAIKKNLKDEDDFVKIFNMLFLCCPFINIQDRYGYTPIMNAALEGNEFYFDLLLENGADFRSFRTYNKENILHIAVKSQNINIIQKLLELGVNPNDLTLKRSNVLHYAASYDNTVEIIELIASKIYNINAMNDHNLTALEMACFFGQSDIAISLIKLGASVFPKFFIDENKAPIFAVEKCSLSTILELEKKSVNFTSDKIYMQKAILGKNMDVINYLIDLYLEKFDEKLRISSDMMSKFIIKIFALKEYVETKIFDSKFAQKLFDESIEFVPEFEQIHNRNSLSSFETESSESISESDNDSFIDSPYSYVRHEYISFLMGE